MKCKIRSIKSKVGSYEIQNQKQEIYSRMTFIKTLSVVFWITKKLLTIV